METTRPVMGAGHWLTPISLRQYWYNALMGTSGLVMCCLVSKARRLGSLNRGTLATKKSVHLSFGDVSYIVAG